MLSCPHCGAELEPALRLVRISQQPVCRSARGRFGLNRREARAVDLVVSGMKNREISKEMGISFQTVKNYLFHAFQKIGCYSRSEMVAMVLLGTDAPRRNQQDE